MILDYSNVTHALSVRAPHAQRILDQTKLDEFRSWPLPAAKIDVPIALHESGGAIIGVISFDVCDWHAGHGLYAWHVGVVWPLDRPVPAKGALRFWTLPEAQRVAVAAQVGPMEVIPWKGRKVR